MIFTPFAFMAPQVVPSFTPADLPGVEMWWKASDNVITSGTDVLTWTDNINGYVLDSANWPGLTTITLNSAWSGGNSQAFMEYGLGGTTQAIATGEFASGITTTDDFSVISIFAPLNPITITANAYQMVGGSLTIGAGGFEMVHTIKNPVSGPNIWGSWNYHNGGVGAKSTSIATVNEQVTLFATTFDDSANTLTSYVDSTTPIGQGTGGGSNRDKSNLRIGVGAYESAGGFPSQGRLAELIVTKNALTATDITNLLTYRNNLYI